MQSSRSATRAGDTGTQGHPGRDGVTDVKRTPAVAGATAADLAPDLRMRNRLLGPVPSGALWAWLGPLLVAVLGGVLRFWHLERPHKLVFDETYYVKQAYTYLKVGYELRWPDKADERFTAGAPDVYLNSADFPVHPPVGKWMIAFGEWLFGIQSSWGWRFSAAVAGTLMIFMVARIGRRLFGSTLLGVTAGLLLAVEGHHFVHSRTSLLDIFLAFWVLAAFGALLVDRDRSRALLARKVTRPRAPGSEADGSARLSRFGPSLGARRWRLLAAVCLGLATGTKWSGLYYLAAFGLMTVLWDVGARRAAGIRSWFLGGLLKDGVPAALTMLPIAFVVYLGSWGGWFASKDAHLRQWGAEHPSSSPVPDALRSLWKYHQDMWAFHVGLSSPHPYQSNPWSWLVQGRPTSFFYEGPKRGQMGCHVDTCSEAITSLGNVVIWWGGTVALAVLLFCWALRRDWRAGALLAGVAAGYLPWFQYQHRTIYTFYAVVFVPFIVLALTYVLGMLLGPPGAPPRRRAVGAFAAGTVVVAAVLCFAFFWPVYVADVIPYAQWHARMWFPSWI